MRIERRVTYRNSLGLKLLNALGSLLDNLRVVSAAKTTVTGNDNKGNLLYVTYFKDG